MTDEIIAHPTYMEHVRHFFEEIDLDHMNTQGVDLSTYALLSARANDVYLHTLQPGGDMPRKRIVSGARSGRRPSSTGSPMACLSVSRRPHW